MEIEKLQILDWKNDNVWIMRLKQSPRMMCYLRKLFNIHSDHILILELEYFQLVAMSTVLTQH